MAETQQKIIERLEAVRVRERDNAFAILRRLTNPESRDTVSDGDMVDAAFTFAASTDLSNPIVPMMSHLLERFMYLANVEETPQGLKRDWMAERS